MRSCAAGASEAPFNLRATALYSVSMSSVDLPPPETPVTQVNRPSGISAVMFFRLLPRALTIFSARRERGLRSGTGTLSSPERYLPVHERGAAMRSSTVPSATTWPPWMPAPGPMSST